MTKELFINGLKVELDDSTKMDLQFKSFLFSTISTVQGNRTWTVSLPKSSTNLKAIENIQSSDSDSIFPYRKYSVTYYENGFRLINNGNAVLIRISDRIEFCFTFGLILDQIKLLGTKKLTELTELSTEYLTWNRYIKYNDISSGFGWCNWFDFTNEDRSYNPITGNPDIPSQVTHPTVMFWWILTKIATEFSLNLDSLINYFNYSTGATGYYIGSPLKSKNGISAINVLKSCSASEQHMDDITRMDFHTSSLTYFVLDSAIYFTKIYKGVSMNIANMNYSQFITPDHISDVEIQICTKDSSNNEIVIKTLDKTPSTGLTNHYTLTNYSFILDKEFDSFYFKLSGYSSGGVGAQTLTFDCSCNSAIYSPIIDLLHVFPGYVGIGFFPIIPNLTDMTCADFILQCSQIAGVFPQNENDNPSIIDFYSAQTIYDNIPNAVDWSDKLIKKKDRLSELEDVVFTVGSYAKKNTLTYKNGDVSTQLVGSINVDNDNLEDEAKLVELKFAAGKRFSDLDNTIDYPLYDIKITDGVLTTTEKNQSDDIIARVMNIGGINKLFWTSNLQFAGIVLSDNYASYQKIVEKPRYLKENFYLKPQDIQGIDLKIPIYLKQYGKYYAIMNLNYSELTSVCELLEVKNI